MFVCPFTGEDNPKKLVPSRRMLLNGKHVVLWVHPKYKNVRFIK